MPDWIHLLPAGTITTQDGRGPYTVASIDALAASLNAGGKLPVDECHSTDLAAPQGAPAPARGWMTEFEARDDGLWALVDWTRAGRQMMEDRAYNGISPVILHTKDHAVSGLLRASLTNAPNLKGLTALHAQTRPEGEANPGTDGETGMDWKAKLIELLGLDAEADDAAIEAALSKKMEAPAAATHAQQGDVTTHPAFMALQSELASVTTALNAQTESTARDKATAFVDGAIAEGRVGVKPARDEYITMHMEDPARAARLIGALPILKGGTALQSEFVPGTGESELDAEDRRVMQLMGISEDAYRESQAASGQKKEIV